MFKIAIDGPSGAGKSSIAKALAKEMGIVYVDTGALYRTIGYYVRSKGVDPKNGEAVGTLLPDIHIEVKYENGTQCVYLNGENLGDRIREPEISMYASAVSAIPTVREFLLETQRSIARANSVVMDGRDIGTVILPDAEVKIFLTASNECRAERRLLELREKGIETTFEEVLADMTERDNNDKNRAVAPAVPAPDAVMLDNSGYTVEQTLAEAMKIIKGKLAERK
jgi:cytidylate kinase